MYDIVAILKSLINKGLTPKEDLQARINALMAFNQITIEEYEELVNLLNKRYDTNETE